MRPITTPTPKPQPKPPAQPTFDITQICINIENDHLISANDIKKIIEIKGDEDKKLTLQ
jgi:hypothetical protein